MRIGLQEVYNDIHGFLAILYHRKATTVPKGREVIVANLWHQEHSRLLHISCVVAVAFSVAL
jgi:hypothetical protein